MKLSEVKVKKTQWDKQAKFGILFMKKKKKKKRRQFESRYSLLLS